MRYFFDSSSLRSRAAIRSCPRSAARTTGRWRARDEQHGNGDATPTGSGPVRLARAEDRPAPAGDHARHRVEREDPLPLRRDLVDVRTSRPRAAARPGGRRGSCSGRRGSATLTATRRKPMPSTVTTASGMNSGASSDLGPGGQVSYIAMMRRAELAAPTRSRRAAPYRRRAAAGPREIDLRHERQVRDEARGSTRSARRRSTASGARRRRRGSGRACRLPGSSRTCRRRSRRRAR